jgi:hypothetical protein
MLQTDLEILESKLKEIGNNNDIKIQIIFHSGNKRTISEAEKISKECLNCPNISYQSGSSSYLKNIKWISVKQNNIALQIFYQ